jgi:hypothetical protein
MQENYLGNSVIEEIGRDPKFIRVYNNTASAVLNGVVTLVVKKWTTLLGVQAVMAAVATNATESNIIGIVNNPGQTGIADKAYGLVQIKGLYGSAAVGAAAAYGAATSGTVHANDYLQVLNGAAVFIDEGGNGGEVEPTDALALAVENITTDVWSVYLLGKLASIQAA